MKRLIYWLLSKLFPYNGMDTIKEDYVSDSEWKLVKIREREAFYGGTDRTE